MGTFLPGSAEVGTPFELFAKQVVELYVGRMNIVTRLKANPKKLYSKPCVRDFGSMRGDYQKPATHKSGLQSLGAIAPTRET